MTDGIAGVLGGLQAGTKPPELAYAEGAHSLNAGFVALAQPGDPKLADSALLQAGFVVENALKTVS